MTAPSNANKSGLSEAWARLSKTFSDRFYEGYEPEIEAMSAAVVTAASAQARIAELEESDKNGRENWDGIIGPLSSYASGQDDYDPILDAAPGGGPDVVGQTFIALLEARKDRATAAEARADRLAKAVDAAIRCLCTRIPGGVLHGDETMSILRTALQQETQP